MVQSLDGLLWRPYKITSYFYEIVNKIAYFLQTDSTLAPADSRTRLINHIFKFARVRTNYESFRHSFFLQHFLTWTASRLAHSGSWNYGWLQIEASFISGLTIRDNLGSCQLLLRIRCILSADNVFLRSIKRTCLITYSLKEYSHVKNILNQTKIY